MSERLIVEFGVEKTVDAGFGYQEKYLTYRDEKIPYKAILKDGQVVAIMHRGYKLIPHELVKKYLARDDLIEKTDERQGGRMYLTLGSKEKSWLEIFVINSIDGSHSLFISLMLKMNGDNGNGLRVWVSPKSKALTMAKMIHKKSAKAEDIPRIVGEILKNSEVIRNLYNAVFDLDAREFMDLWNLLKEEIPEKYVRQIYAKLAVSKDKVSVGEVYQDVAKRIWTTDNYMATKLTFLQSLDEIVWMIYESKR